MLTKNRKFTFKRWFAHWCAFQLTSLKHNKHKFKYFFHDIDKPFLNLFLSNKKVTQIHRDNSSHHFKNGEIKDCYAAVFDWDCSWLTKPDAQMGARETFEKLFENKLSYKTRRKIEYILTELGL